MENGRNGRQRNVATVGHGVGTVCRPCAYVRSRPGTRERVRKAAIDKPEATVLVSFTGRSLLRNFVDLLERVARRVHVDGRVLSCVDQTGHKGSDQVKAFSDELAGSNPAATNHPDWPCRPVAGMMG
jgi:hypothetical protein